MMSESQRTLLRTHGTLLGRVLLGLLFLVSGLGMLANEAGVAGVAGMIGEKGLPLASLLAWIVVLTKVVGGSALILGYKVGKAACALFGFTLLATLFFHMGNGITDIMLLKNLSIMGGLLYVMAYGPGEGWRLRMGDSN